MVAYANPLYENDENDGLISYEEVISFVTDNEINIKNMSREEIIDLVINIESEWMESSADSLFNFNEVCNWLIDLRDSLF